MKKLVLFFLILGTFFLSRPSRSMAVTVSGSALLEGQSDHSGISVIFHRTTPSEARDTAYTDQSGHYSADILTGIYEITFSKNNFYAQSLKEQVIYEDKTIETVTLTSAGLSGRQKGVIAKGDYIVGDSIWIQNPDTLKIEPGTRLFFRKGTGLTVYGFLDAQGTEQDSIIFTRYLGANDNPDSTYWKGIVLKSDYAQNTQETNQIMKYCHISFCREKAMDIQSCHPDIENVLISDCIGWYIVMTYWLDGKLKNIKFVNCNSADTSIYPGASCLYTIGTTDNQSISNIEITGIKSKSMAAVGFYSVNNCKFNNFYIHDNNCPFICYDSYVTFNNSTIVNNSFGKTFETGAASFNNCIIANNPGGKWNNVRYSDFYNNGGFDTEKNKWLGVNVTVNKNGDSCDAFGNIQLDPQFNNPALMDYSLRSSSPCIDAGSNDSVRTSQDILGNARIWDGNMDGDSLVDMGCYEYGAPPMTKINLVDQDFESGLSGWKINSDGSQNAWKIEKNESKAHSYSSYASLKCEGSHSYSSIVSPYMYLPVSDNLRLGFYLSYIHDMSKVNKDKETPQTEETRELQVSLQVKDQSSEVILGTIKDISQGWSGHVFDLGVYRGKEVKIGFRGNLSTDDANTPEILLDDIKIEADKVLSVDDGPVTSGFDGNALLYPNPASDYIYIQTGEGMTAPFSIAVYNIMGEKVIDTGITGDNGKIDVSSLPSGVYYLSMTNGKETRRERMIVSH